MDLPRAQNPSPFGLMGLNWGSALLLVTLGYLWFVLINQLRVEWLVNPEYSYGWAVPLLCIGLLIRRWHMARLWGIADKPDDKTRLKNMRLMAAFAGAAFLYLPTRLVQEANPEWRLISWALAIEVVTLTMIAIRVALGGSLAGWLAFPICFFLVAVPWPTPIEAPFIQSLTRINSEITVELLGWMGVPAIQHGNLIEVGTGTIGVSEACSGIRSFQTSLMISLFFGEFYRMEGVRRLLLIPAGFILAMALNVSRMTLLTMIAAKKGIAAIDTYHDTAGVTIALICTAGLWGLALLMNQRGRADVENMPASPQNGVTPSEFRSRSVRVSILPLATILLVWVVLAELGVESWYRWHEAQLPKSVSWSIAWPRANPTFLESPLDQKVKRLLRYDDGCSAFWKEDGIQWQMIYLHWLPGRIAVHLAKSHTPEICLPAAGHKVQTLSDLSYFSVQGLRLPFQSYILNDGGEPSYVFYCLWEDRARTEFFQTTQFTYDRRFEPVIRGERNAGQRSLEIVVRGIGDLKEAQVALGKELNRIIRIQPESAPSKNEYAL